MDIETLLGDNDPDNAGESIVADGAYDDASDTDEDLNQRARTENEYIRSLFTESGLILLQEDNIRRAYARGGEAGLFALFVIANFRASIRRWTNEAMEESGAKAITESELDAYLGLELAMSITSINEISDFWSSKRFLGTSDFSDTMSRNRFQQIRSHLKAHPANVATDTEMANDPLWHSRTLLRHIQKKLSRLAVPYGASSLDENSIRTKARTKAKSYMPSKPDKYALRFYAVVGWQSLYIHSIWGNGSGNTSATTPPDRYTATFPDLRTPLRNTLRLPGIHVATGSPTALWVAMMGHQTRVRESPSGRRLLVTDNFYTRHFLARALQRFTDGEARLLGTVRLNLVDKWNKVKLTEVSERVADMERGAWELVATVEPTTGWQQRQAAHKQRQAHLPKNSRTTYIGPVTVVANAGFVVFKDKKLLGHYPAPTHEQLSAVTASIPSNVGRGVR